MNHGAVAGIVPAGMIGTQELLIVLVIVLILFGAGRLPQVFASFGKGLKSFRDAQREGGDPPAVDAQRRGLTEDPLDATEVSREKERVGKT